MNQRQALEQRKREVAAERAKGHEQRADRNQRAILGRRRAEAFDRCGRIFRAALKLLRGT